MSNQTIEHYLAVFSDLQNERKELDSHIRWIEGRIRSLGGRVPASAEIPNSKQGEGSSQKTNTSHFQPKPPGTTLNDMCEAILRSEQKPLRGKVILEKLKAAGRNQTTMKSLAGAMPQDKKRRFENLGENTWALKEWPEDTKSEYRVRRPDPRLLTGA